MNAHLLGVIEIARPDDRLRCYVRRRPDGGRRVKARLVRGGRVVEEQVFEFDEQLSLGDPEALLERTMREIAAAAGGRVRIMTEVREHGRNEPPRFA